MSTEAPKSGQRRRRRRKKSSGDRAAAAAVATVEILPGMIPDEDTLAEFILEGRIGGAGIDVFEQEPPDVTRPEYKQDNMVVMPHTAGSTDGTARKRAACAARNVDLIAAGKEPLYRIDL